MASTYSNLKIELIGTGEQVGQWGSTTNTNLGTAIEEAIVGSADVTFASADVNLTLTNTNATQAARNYRLNLTGTSGGARSLFLSSGANIEKPYIINNGLADDVTVQNKIGGVASGSSVVVPAGKSVMVYNTGTNIVEAYNYTPVSSGGTGRSTLTADNVILGNGTSPVQFVAPGASGSVLKSTGTTWASGAVPAGGSNGQVQYNASGNLVGSASLTFNSGTGELSATSFSGSGASLTALNASNISSGTLAVARGGTGAGSFTSGSILKGNGTSQILEATGADIVSVIGSTAVTNATNATNATLATRATNVAGGAANQIVYNTGSNTSAFITAPTVASTFLQWNGANFTWAAASGGGGVTSVSGTGTVSGLTLSGTVTSTGSLTLGGTLSLTSANVTSALGYTPYDGSTNPNGYVTSSSLSGYAQLSGTNGFTGANSFSGGITSQAYNFSSSTSVYGGNLIGGQYYDISFDVVGIAHMKIQYNAQILFYKNIVPTPDNSLTCGANGNRWSAVWAANGTIQTSDQRLKTDVTNSQLGLSFINKLRPVSYKWIVGSNEIIDYVDEDILDEQGNVIHTTKVPKIAPRPGTRTHYGLISQEVKAALDSENVGDFGGWVLDDKNDPTSTQNLRYDQFISPLIKAVQELSAKVNTLEAELAALKGN